jgi:hypothetical protein
MARSNANVQMSDAGDYTVMAVNTYGSVNSSVAMLTVELPTPTAYSPPRLAGIGSAGRGSAAILTEMRFLKGASRNKLYNRGKEFFA